MLGYLVGRLAQAVPVLVLASLAVFFVLRLVPGDPADALAGEDATPADVEAIREELGLKDPIPVQYARWISDLVRGDLGVSIRTGIPISRLVKLSFPPTIEFAVASYVIAILIGIPLGTIAGVKPRSGWDWFLSFFTISTLGVPNFLLGVLLLWLFSVNLGWLPVSGRVSIFDDPIQSIKAPHPAVVRSRQWTRGSAGAGTPAPLSRKPWARTTSVRRGRKVFHHG